MERPRRILTLPRLGILAAVVAGQECSRLNNQKSRGVIRLKVSPTHHPLNKPRVPPEGRATVKSEPFRAHERDSLFIHSHRQLMVLRGQHWDGFDEFT